MANSSKIKPASMTVVEAAQRYPGIPKKRFQQMCLRGQRLKRIYESWNIPAEEAAKALFAKKVGQIWVIPVEELDRVFSP